MIIMETWELTKEEIKKMPAEKQKAYNLAAMYAKCEDARDWSKGFEMLKELGWKEVKTKQGLRTFITLVKPT